MAFDLADYEPVATRLAKFYADHPNGRVLTDLKASDGGTFIVAATLYKDESDLIWTTGLATETMGGSGANAECALENCETSAIGRALANAGYAGSDPAKRASREEMAKVNRGPVIKTSGGQSASGASPKQRDFFFKLLDEKDISGLGDLPDIDSLSKGAASEWIDKLVKCPDVPKAVRGATVGAAVEALQDSLGAVEYPPGEEAF